MTNLERAVQAVESDLRPAVYIAGRPHQRITLNERMAHYNVPGFRRCSETTLYSLRDFTRKTHVKMPSYF